MAESEDWTRKGATLSHITAEKEYGVDLEFIEQGIREGKLEYRHGAVWGNPYVKVLRSQLEKYIAEKLGKNHLSNEKAQTELKKIKRELTSLKKKVKELELRKATLEKELGK